MYLIYGLFERSDRPDGAFLSKRWVGLEDLLEHGGVGNIQAKIDEWEGARAARHRATVGAVFEAAEPRAERRATHSSDDSGEGDSDDSGEEGEEGEVRGEGGEGEGAAEGQEGPAAGSKRPRACLAPLAAVPMQQV